MRLASCSYYSFLLAIPPCLLTPVLLLQGEYLQNLSREDLETLMQLGSLTVPQLMGEVWTPEHLDTSTPELLNTFT